MSRARSLVSLVLTTLLLTSASARADDPHELAFDGTTTALSLSLLSAGNLALMFGAEPPQACRVCTIPVIDQSVALWLGSQRNPDLYSTVSDYLVLGGLALGGTASLIGERDAKLWAQDLAITSESFLATMLVVLAVKRLSARVRPAVHFNHPNPHLSRDEYYQSFVSGHSAAIASIAASAVTLAYLRDYGYRNIALITGIAFTLSVGILRIAADRHWLTDVVTGWVIGATFGVFIPLLFHARKETPQPTEAALRQQLPLLAFTF